MSIWQIIYNFLSSWLPSTPKRINLLDDEFVTEDGEVNHE